VNFNQVIIDARLTFDPELRHTQSGKVTATLRLASNPSKNERLFIDAVCWDKTAELACEHLRKGSRVLVVGRLKMDEWEDKQTGEKRSKLVVVASTIQFLDGKPKDEKGGNDDIPY
jgi:single-strand DNA-binding protein